MDFYRSLAVGDQDIPYPGWKTVERYLLNPQSWPSDELSLHAGDEETWLIVIHVAQTGFVVYGLGLHDKDYYFLSDPDLDEEMMEYHYAGEPAWLPRFAFVNEALMLRAMRSFYETGKRDETFYWWREDELCALFDI